MSLPSSRASGSRRLARDLFVHADDEGEETGYSARAAAEEAAAAAEEAAARAAAEEAAAAAAAYAAARADFAAGRTLEITTQVGATVRTLEPGDGVHFPKPGSYVRIHYEAFVEGAEEGAFDSSRARAQFFEYQQGSGYLLKGLEDAMELLSRGQCAHVILAPHAAYGKTGFPPVVPRMAAIRYEVQVYAVE
jgi:FK506-binding protein 1